MPLSPARTWREGGAAQRLPLLRVGQGQVQREPGGAVVVKQGVGVALPRRPRRRRRLLQAPRLPLLRPLLLRCCIPGLRRRGCTPHLPARCPRLPRPVGQVHAGGGVGGGDQQAAAVQLQPQHSQPLANLGRVEGRRGPGSSGQA